MSVTRFPDFGELYRAAFAETDEREKSSLLGEVERIIRNSQAEVATDASRETKAA